MRMGDDAYAVVNRHRAVGNKVAKVPDIATISPTGQRMLCNHANGFVQNHQPLQRGALMPRQRIGKGDGHHQRADIDPDQRQPQQRNPSPAWISTPIETGHSAIHAKRAKPTNAQNITTIAALASAIRQASRRGF